MPVVMEAVRINRALMRISHEIVEQNREIEELALVGIRTRGVPIAKRIASNIFEIVNHTVPSGMLDITLYRDDLMAIGPLPVVGATVLPEGRTPLVQSLASDESGTMSTPHPSSRSGTDTSTD